jgi:chromosome segregation ATPase
MASDRRWEPNGGGGRPPPPSRTPSGPQSHPPSSSRQSAADNISNDVEPFRLTTYTAPCSIALTLTSLLGEATHKYVKMKDAENERKQIMDEWTKNEQYFNTHPKIKETFEGRRQKYESTYNNARDDYQRAARQTEPLLRQIEALEQQLPRDKDIRKIFEQEFKKQPRFVTPALLKEQMDDLWRDVAKKSKNMEDIAYEHKTDLDRLSVEVKNLNLNPRSRQESASSETSFREVEARLQPKIDNVRKTLNNEVRSLNEKVDKLQKEKDTAAQPQRRISLTPTAKAEDIVRVTPLFVAPSHPN